MTGNRWSARPASLFEILFSIFALVAAQVALATDVNIKIIDPEPTHVHPPGAPFEIEVEIPAVSVNSDILYHWVSPDDRVLTEPAKIPTGETTKVQSPSGDIGHYRLRFTASNPESVQFPQQERGFHKDFGFSILMPPMQAPADRPIDLDSFFGMVDADWRDPYLRGHIRTVTWHSTPSEVAQAVQEGRGAGLEETLLVSGAAWQSVNRDEKPIGDDELSRLENKLGAILDEMTNRGIAPLDTIQAGRRDNAGDVLEKPYFLQNLERKLATVRKTLDTNGMTDTRIMYNTGGMDLSTLAEVKAILTSAAAPYMDVFAHNPYDGANFRSPEAWLPKMINRIHRYMGLNPEGPRSLQFGELGLPVRANQHEKTTLTTRETSAVSPLQQGLYLTKAHIVALASKKVDAAYLYNYQDQTNARGDAESQFGLRTFAQSPSGDTIPGFPRPAYNAYANMVDLLTTDMRFFEQREIGKNGRVYEFRSDETDQPALLVAWVHPDGAEVHPLAELGKGVSKSTVIESVDMFGAPIALDGDKIRLDEKPVYLLVKATSAADTTMDGKQTSAFTAAAVVGSFPVDLTGATPEEKTITVDVSKSGSPTDARLSMSVFDADNAEGALYINGNGPVQLFGSQASSANDGITKTVTFDTPASWWVNGNNTLRFTHTSTQGYRVDSASVSFSGSTGAFPVDLTGSTPEERTITFNVSKSGSPTDATLSMSVFDADNTEGALYVNGNGPIQLFGSQASSANDGITKTVTFDTPASWWKDGANSLRFTHTSTQGYRVDSASVSFSGSTGSGGFPVDLTGTTPEEKTVNINASKSGTPTDATLTMSVFDADNAEGALYINGNGPVQLFGSQGSSANDGVTRTVTFTTPAAWWVNGGNSLRFTHTSTQGYRVDSAAVTFSGSTGSGNFPVDLTGGTPEEKTISLNVSKSGSPNTATISMSAYDADNTEGALYVNGNGPIQLFGSQGSSANDGVIKTVSFNTPASWWVNGANSLRFTHTSTQGYRIDNASVSFSTIEGGAVYYVDRGHSAASDSNPGTQSQPWKTIQKAANTLTAGETVYIKKGTYREGVEVKNSGSAGKPITFAAYPGHEHQVILDGEFRGDREIVFNIPGRSWITVTGLKAINSDSRGFSVYGPSTGVVIDNNATYNTRSSGIAAWGKNYGQGLADSLITNITITNNLIEGAVTSEHNECITLANGVDGFEIAYNEVDGAGLTNRRAGMPGGEGIDVKYGVKNGSIHHNYVHHVKHGMWIDGVRYVRNVDVYNNLITHSGVGTLEGGEGIGIVTENDNYTSQREVSDLHIYNNIIRDNKKHGVVLFRHPEDTSGRTIHRVLLEHNSLTRNGYAGVRFDYPNVDNFVVRNNIAYANSGQNIDLSSGVADQANLTSNPSWTNASGNDFTLRSGSSAIDAGVSTSVNTDYNGTLRPQGGRVDIGAYEWKP